MGIYAGMDSIVLADNAVKTRLDVRAVIIHMQSSFHKRAAMAILRRELACLRLPGTALRDCFPTSVIAKVKKYIRLGMDLKSAGKISMFQVINRKGQLILQMGTRNQPYGDYQGNADEEEPAAADNNQWTLVESRRKRPHPEGTLTSPNSRPLAADRSLNVVSSPTAATWAALTEQEFPELVSQPKPQTSKQSQPPSDKQNQKPAAANKHQSPVCSTPKSGEIVINFSSLAIYTVHTDIHSIHTIHTYIQHIYTTDTCNTCIQHIYMYNTYIQHIHAIHTIHTYHYTSFAFIFNL
jgi:hypothetical protein